MKTKNMENELLLPEPIGNFILQQTDCPGVDLPNGRYWHYSEVCLLLGRMQEVGNRDARMFMLWVYDEDFIQDEDGSWFERPDFIHQDKGRLVATNTKQLFEVHKRNGCILPNQGEGLGESKTQINMEQTFTRADLVSFGEYLLSEERQQMLAGNSPDLLEERSKQVHHADIENWLEKSEVTA